MKEKAPYIVKVDVDMTVIYNRDKVFLKNRQYSCLVMYLLCM